MATIEQVAGIVDRAATDAAFRQRLKSDPAATLRAAGIDVPAGSEVRVLENTDRVRHFVLPRKPADVPAQAPGEAPSAAAKNTVAEKLAAHGQLVVEAWNDPHLRARLMENPAAVLAERGITVPGGPEIRVVEATDRVHFLTLTPAASH